jgi:acetolactate synthase-1/2/3 large subunit
MADAVEAARALVSTRNLPVIANGMGRGIVPPGDPHLVTRARSAAFRGADLVIVAGTPLDFRLGFGVFGDPPAKVIHLVDAETERSTAATVSCTVVGDLRLSLGPSPTARSGVRRFPCGMRRRPRSLAIGWISSTTAS